LGVSGDQFQRGRRLSLQCSSAGSDQTEHENRQLLVEVGSWVRQAPTPGIERTMRFLQTTGAPTLLGLASRALPTPSPGSPGHVGDCRYELIRLEGLHHVHVET
jgi:hypothetical protein